ncbi:MAG TPA: M10 family metallopeptidase C-terminal domain-containing protein, partial [Allosphingosinicella sp.]|nr:M10 family metallopeptidase C-terminal domain-containing protein [Allosphingosinicella sp.]
MPSIIPSPGAPPGSPNVASTIELSADYSLAAGTILFADAIAVLFRTAGLQFPYYSLVNAGTLWNRTANGASVVDTYNFGSIRNSGLIVAEATNGSARAISVGSAFGGLTNSGQIFALSTGGLASGIEIWAGSGIDIVNSGLIAARSDHEAWAISRYNGGRVVNDATGSILAEGANAIAIFLGRGHLTPPGQPELADIDNAGRIEAVSTDPSEASVAILLEGLEHETMRVVNSGVIRGDYAIFASGYGFSPPQRNDDTIINRGSGLIEGIISLEMGNDRIVNEGTIQGYVDLFDGEDVFDNSLGTLIGAANLGWGDDRFVGGVHSDAVMGERDDDELYGNGGDDLLLGGRGNDLLVGGAGNDALFGEFGDDIIVTFGSDRARGGPGDDRVQLGDYTFTSAHGEAGRDVLILPDTAKLLDLAAALGTARLSGFESIVLPGAQGLVIRPQDIALMTGGGSLLTVSATAAGTIHLVGSWSIGALQEIGGVQYRLHASGANQVLVQDGAGVAVLASAPVGATGLDSPTGNAPPAPGSVPGTYLEGSNFIATNYALNADFTIDADEHWASEGGAAIFAASDPFVRFVNNGTLVSEGGANGATGLRLTYLSSFHNEGSVTVSAQGNGSSLASNLSYLTTYGVDIAARNLIGNVYGIYQGGGLVPVYNAGSISASAEASVAGAYVNWGMDLVNEGDILASSSGFVAVGVYAANGGLLVNHGTISANGSVAAYGVRSSTHVVTLENHGLIGATAQQAGAEAIALSFYYQLGNATVLNVGTIRGDIAIQSSWMVNGGGLRLLNTGLIDGRIVLNVNPNGGPARTDVISNQGIINGEVRLGGERDIYIGTAGQQSGAILGEGGSDLLFGTVGADTLSGGEDGDYLIGGGGADALTGGAGGDRFVYRAAAESTGSAFDTIADFQTGLDLIDLSALGVTSWSFAPGGGFTTLIAATASGAFEVRIVGTVAASDLVLASVPTVNGTAAADLIAATAAGSTLDGGEGDDLLMGAAGNDRLIGGGGIDVYWGGAGDDVYIVESADDLIFEVAGEGVDRVEFSGWHPSLSYTLADQVENLALVVGGTGIGNALDNVI